MTRVPIDRRDIDDVLAPLGESLTLPTEACTSQEVFDWEMGQVFGAARACVGRVDELVGTGQIRAIDVLGDGVLLARDSERKLAAFSNVRRHRGHELAPVGEAIDASLICSDGFVIATAPSREGAL